MRACVIHGVEDLRLEERPSEALGERGVRVRVRAGGICGSDLHYYQHGGFGAAASTSPWCWATRWPAFSKVAPDVTHLAVGARRIAVNPSHACGQCRFCQLGPQNHCLDMRYYGSAMRTPHVQGAFRQRIVCEPALAFKIAATTK